MPRPAIRFYLHSVARRDGHRVLYISVGAGNGRPVRMSTGYTVESAHFSPQAPHIAEGAANFQALNEKLNALHQTLVKTRQNLEEEGRLSSAALTPLVQQAIAALGSRLANKPLAGSDSAPSNLPLPQQPIRAVLTAWLAGKQSRRTSATQARKCVDWVEKFDPGATPATIDEGWVKRHTAFLVRHSILDTSIPHHLSLLQHLVAHAGLPATHIKGGILRKTTMCYLTWEEVQQLHAWQPPDKPSLRLQKDVFVIRCLCGISQAEAIALLRTPSEYFSHRLPFHQHELSGAAIPHAIMTMLEEILSKYRTQPTQVFPVVSRQQTHHLIGQLLQGASIDAPYLKVRYKAAVKRQQTIPKWQAASTYTPYHTYAALLARLQVDPLTMHELLGYRNFTSTMGYILAAQEGID